MKVVVTGCAGFIGSHMVDRLLGDGHTVVGIDNFSTGIRRFLEKSLGHPRFRLVEGDLLEADRLPEWFEGGDLVVHFAANADVRYGTAHPRKDIEQNTLATHNVLEAMRATGVSRIAFSSTGSVYGEAEVIPTPEDAPFPVQTSLYGASKLAAEGLIAAYCEGFGFTSWIFRFVSILGERYTHGHVFDFCQQLRRRSVAPAGARQRRPAQVVSPCSRLHRCRPRSGRPRNGPHQYLQSGRRRVLHRQGLNRLDQRGAAGEACPGVWRR